MGILVGGTAAAGILVGAAQAAGVLVGGGLAWPAGQADLVIAGLQWSVDGGSSYSNDPVPASTDALLRASVKNTGGTSVPSQQFSTWLGVREAPGQPYITVDNITYSNGLAPGAEVHLVAAWNSGASGAKTFAATADTSAVIAEGNEGNNTSSIAMTVEQAAGLDVPEILWVQDFETDGNFEPDAQINDSLTGSQPSQIDFGIKTDNPHTGDESIWTQISSTPGTTNRAIRLQMWEQYQIPDQVYTSAWYFIPADVVHSGNGWNITDFKTSYNDPNGGGDASDPTISVDIEDLGDNTYRLNPFYKVDPNGEHTKWGGSFNNYIHNTTNVTFNGGEWVHIEFYIVWSETGSGVIKIWINGQLDFSRVGNGVRGDGSCNGTHEVADCAFDTLIPLAPNGLNPHSRADGGNIRWIKLNHYTGGVLSPLPVEVYFDDWVIVETTDGGVGDDRMWLVWAAGADVGRFYPRSGSDDAWENGAGTVDTNDTTIELGAGNTIMLRMNEVRIPQGAVIDHASLMFSSAATDTAATSITISAEDADDCATATTAANSITGRPKTASSVIWSMPSWSAPAYSGSYRNFRNLTMKSPDLTSLIQEVVDRGGWTFDNDLCLIMEGTGSRVFGADEHSTLFPPDLYVVWH